MITYKNRIRAISIVAVLTFILFYLSILSVSHVVEVQLIDFRLPAEDQNVYLLFARNLNTLITNNVFFSVLMLFYIVLFETIHKRGTIIFDIRTSRKKRFNDVTKEIIKITALYVTTVFISFAISVCLVLSGESRLDIILNFSLFLIVQSVLISLTSLLIHNVVKTIIPISNLISLSIIFVINAFYLLLSGGLNLEKNINYEKNGIIIAVVICILYILMYLCIINKEYLE